MAGLKFVRTRSKSRPSGRPSRSATPRPPRLPTSQRTGASSSTGPTLMSSFCARARRSTAATTQARSQTGWRPRASSATRLKSRTSSCTSTSLPRSRASRPRSTSSRARARKRTSGRLRSAAQDLLREAREQRVRGDVQVDPARSRWRPDLRESRGAVLQAARAENLNEMRWQQQMSGRCMGSTSVMSCRVE